MMPLVERLHRAHGSPNWPHLEHAIALLLDVAWNDPEFPVRPRLVLVRGGPYSDPDPEDGWIEELPL